MTHYISTYNEVTELKDSLNQAIIASGKWDNLITNNLCDVIELKDNKGALPIVAGYEAYYPDYAINEAREIEAHEKLGYEEWHEDTEIQVFLSHINNANMLVDYPEIGQYRKDNNIITYIEDNGIYVYLNHLNEEHETILNQYNANIDKKE